MSGATDTAFSAAAGRIGRILAGGDPRLSTPTPPLVQAVRHAAAAVGHRAIPVGAVGPDEDPREAADRLARASGLHAVPIALGDQRIGEAPVPLLAWRKRADGPSEPVLLHRRGRRWREAAAATGWVPRPAGLLRLDDCEPDAVMILPMLADGPVRARALLGFGLSVAWRDLLAFVVLGLAAGGLLALLPLLTGPLFTTIVPENDMALLRDMVVFFGVLLLGHSATGMAAGVARLRIDGRVGFLLRAAAIDRAIRLARRTDRGAAMPPAPIAAYSTRSIERWHRGVWGMALSVVSALLIAVPSILAVAATSAPGAALVGAIALASLAAGALIALRRVRALLNGLAAPQSWMTTAFEGLAAIDTVRASGAGARVFDRWTDGYLTLGARFLRADRVGAGAAALEDAVNGLLVLGAVVALALASGAGTAQPIGLVVAAGAVAGAVTAMLGALSQATTLGLQLRMIRPLLEGTPVPPADGAPPPRLGGRITLDNVTVRHAPGTAPALQSLSVGIEPGEHVGVAGPSGAGKSTLIRTILGMVRPDDGRICFDGLDLADLDAERLRRQIGVVGQGGSLFAGTLHDNIAAGEPLDRDQVLEAARRASLDDLLAALPLGLGTPIGDVDPGFSGGQIQRILLARAFATRPKILILDEATSALDPAHQQHVAFAIDAMNATVITVAHRLETLRTCDRILVLDRGRLVEDGHHSELAASGGLFARLLGADAAAA